jgi:hypothetical protein
VVEKKVSEFRRSGFKETNEMKRQKRCFMQVMVCHELVGVGVIAIDIRG